MVFRFLLALSTILPLSSFALMPQAQEARTRWERMAQIRRDKLDYVLPEVMRENGIDMWITMIREANYKTLHADLGEGYASSDGFYVFSLPRTEKAASGEATSEEPRLRVERAVFGITGYHIERSGAYDEFLGLEAFAEYVQARDPKVIAINTSRNLGPVDTLTHTGYEQLVETLGVSYAQRFVSAEKLVAEFRSRRVASELAAFAEAGEISRTLAERALSNEVIIPGVTRLEDVAWWLMDRLLEKGLGSSFGMPSIYVTGPDGIAAVSTDRIIQRGDVLMIDWGVGFLNLFTDMKRMAYVLKPGEIQAPSGLQHAFDRARKARGVIVKAIRPGITAAQAEKDIYAALAQEGFRKIDFNQPTDDLESTDIVIGCHSVGNTSHGIGPSIAFFNPVRIQYELRPSNLLSIELFAYTAMPEWGGAKVRIPLEDDAVLTERGVEWLYPVNDKILLVR